jgi:hypothetical protein
MPDDQPAAPAAVHSEGECPSWCTGCGVNELRHASEYDGTSAPDLDSEWHVLARTVQDRHGDGPVLVELAVLDEDGNEAVIRLTPDQASELSAAIDFSTGCALRIA